MKTIAFNVLALFAGLFIGSLVNIGLVTLGPHVIENPVGVDMSDVDKMRESMKLLQPANFIFPFLAHALGTLAGAAIAARTAASHPMIFAASIALVFLAGGITMVVSVGGPSWFVLPDLLLAYIPMGILGGYLALPRVSSIPKE